MAKKEIPLWGYLLESSQRHSTIDQNQAELMGVFVKGRTSRHTSSFTPYMKRGEFIEAMNLLSLANTEIGPQESTQPSEGAVSLSITRDINESIDELIISPWIEGHKSGGGESASSGIESSLLFGVGRACDNINKVNDPAKVSINNIQNKVQKETDISQVGQERFREETVVEKGTSNDLSISSEIIKVESQLPMEQISQNQKKIGEIRLQPSVGKNYYQSGRNNDHASYQKVIDEREIRLRMVDSNLKKGVKMTADRFILRQSLLNKMNLVGEKDYPDKVLPFEPRIENYAGYQLPLLDLYKSIPSWTEGAEVVLRQIKELLPLLTKKVEEAREHSKPNLQNPEKIPSENRRRKTQPPSIEKGYSDYLTRSYQGNFHIGI